MHASDDVKFPIAEPWTELYDLYELIKKSNCT